MRLMFSDSGGTGNGICEKEARVRAFMRMLRVGEGTSNEDGYRKLYGHDDFTGSLHNKDMSTHPNILIKKGKYSSTAAGAYQILYNTYNDFIKNKRIEKYNIKDFSPVSQDEICLLILKYNYRKGRSKSFFFDKNGNEIERRKKFKGIKCDIIQKIIDNELDYALLTSSLCWASLPNAPYGQPSKTLPEVKRLYFKFLVEELNGKSTLNLESGFLKRFGYSCCDDDTSEGDNNIRIVRKWERWTGVNKSSATFSEFSFGNLKGFICEPYGEETVESGKDKRIPVGTYNLKWHTSTKYPKNKYTLQHDFGKKKKLDYPELEKGVVCVYNDQVSTGRGILIHAGRDGGWTEGCILPSSTLDKDEDKRNMNLSQSVNTLHTILEQIAFIGIDKVKLIITDEIP